MARLRTILVLGFGFVALHGLVAADIPAVLRAQLGPAADVREVRDGVAEGTRPYLQRIEIGGESLSLYFRNDVGAWILPNFAFELYNGEGVRLDAWVEPTNKRPIDPGTVSIQHLSWKRVSARAADGNAAGTQAASGGDVRFIRVIDRCLFSDRQPGLPKPEAKPPLLKQALPRSDQVGDIAYSAKWNEFGAYLQRLIDGVQREWEKAISASKILPPSGAKVKVRFSLNALGEVTSCAVTESAAGEVAGELCVAALKGRAPYGTWPAAMRAALGDRQELTFTFFYQ